MWPQRRRSCALLLQWWPRRGHPSVSFFTLVAAARTRLHLIVAVVAAVRTQLRLIVTVVAAAWTRLGLFVPVVTVART